MKETNLYLYWSCSNFLYHWSKTNYKEKPIPGRKTLRLVKAWKTKNACNKHPAWKMLFVACDKRSSNSESESQSLHRLCLSNILKSSPGTEWKYLGYLRNFAPRTLWARPGRPQTSLLMTPDRSYFWLLWLPYYIFCELSIL